MKHPKADPPPKMMTSTFEVGTFSLRLVIEDGTVHQFWSPRRPVKGDLVTRHLGQLRDGRVKLFRAWSIAEDLPPGVF